ncbi:hypothetical protein NMY22_g7726 [Coprinellus aureogranulatus]|nr:hypothetical protein NMY22_g7726 [Coprinellus aureogranulatus]
MAPRSSSSKSVIPAGYTFLNPETMISVKGKELAEELRKKADGRDPDAFDMYVFNDFYGYGVMDLIDETLTTLHTKITKKSYDDAYPLLEAITVFMDYEDIWTQIDDAERVELTNKLYGALAVALLRGLKKAGRLDKESFPSLEYLLKGITSIGDTLDDVGCESSDYTRVSRGIARRLFKDKSKEDFDLEKKQRKEWLKSIKDKEEKGIMKAEMKIVEKQKDQEPWYMEGEVCDEDKRNSSYSLSTVYKEYKAYVPPAPKGVSRLLTPTFGWDIEEWPEKKKKQYSFEGRSTGY